MVGQETIYPIAERAQHQLQQTAATPLGTAARFQKWCDDEK